MKKKVFITGGAGFIGSNAAYYFLKKGYNVTIFDNFSRKGSKLNVEWLKENFKQGLTVVKGDVTKDVKKIAEEMRGAYLILHLAGQVAVTTSVVNPREDFEVNALGTFNALEAVRMTGEKPIFIYSSTNKVYGGLEDLSVSETKT